MIIIKIHYHPLSSIIGYNTDNTDNMDYNLILSIIIRSSKKNYIYIYTYNTNLLIKIILSIVILK